MNKKPLLMIIDDEPEIADLVGDTAEMVGFETVRTTRVRDFLKIERERQPEVIITDLCIPEMDGIELLQELSNRGCNAGIILMSGYGGRYIPMAESMAEGLSLHHINSLDKPFRIQTLKEQLTTALEWCASQTRDA